MRYYDLHWGVFVYSRHARGVNPPVKIPGATCASEPDCESGGAGSQADQLYMDLPSKIAPLSNIQYGDGQCEITSLLREDVSASRIHGIRLYDGVAL